MNRCSSPGAHSASSLVIPVQTPEWVTRLPFQLLTTIVDEPLKYGKYLSLKNHLAKLPRPPSRNAALD